MVVLILDFDSTITTESTLVQLYLRLPEEVFKNAISISNKDYYDKELPLTRACYKNIKQAINHESNWENCLKEIIGLVLRYSRDIEPLEVKGMNLIEGPLKHLDILGLERAASQIRVRAGFSSLVKSFSPSVYILSCNWSTDLIKLVCPEVESKNILANTLKFRNGNCKGFDKRRIILTPEHKFKEFQKLKDDTSIACGDSLPDLLLLLTAEKGFAFVSHDPDFIDVCQLIRVKFSRAIYVVNSFEDVQRILK